MDVSVDNFPISRSNSIILDLKSNYNLYNQQNIDGAFIAVHIQKIYMVAKLHENTGEYANECLVDKVGEKIFFHLYTSFIASLMFSVDILLHCSIYNL